MFRAPIGFILIVLNLYLTNSKRIETHTLDPQIFSQTIFSKLTASSSSSSSSECKFRGDEFSNANSCHNDHISLKSFLSSVVLKATAYEKIKHKRKSKSILFQIERIFKYEKTDSQIYLSEQRENSALILNLNSFILVDDISSCDSNSSIELGKSYVLFLNSRSKSNFFTHPIRIDPGAGSLWNKKSNHLVRHQSKAAALVRLPTFSLFAPALRLDLCVNEYRNVVAEIEQSSCETCFKKPSINIEKKLQLVDEHDNVSLECSYEGNPLPLVYWMKLNLLSNKFELIKADRNKYTIINQRNRKSLLTIQNIDQNDKQNEYICFSYDFMMRKFLLDRTKFYIQTPKSSRNRISAPLNATLFTKSFASKAHKAHKTRRKLLKNVQPYDNHTTTTTQTAATRAYDFNTSSLISAKTSTNTHHHNNLSSNSTVAAKTRRKSRKYVQCDKSESDCQNEGTCYTTNPALIANSKTYRQRKVKFCICKQYFEGPHCEIALMRTILFDEKEIPDDMRQTWNSLGYSSEIDQK